MFSDAVVGLDEVFGGAVVTYRDRQHLAELLRRPLDEVFPDLDRRLEVAATVARDHSFDARARTLLDGRARRPRLASTPVGSIPAPTDRSHDATPSWHRDDAALQAHPAQASRVKLSVLMPVYDEAATVAAAVKRVLDVDWPCEVELVVVDDGSTDGTGAVLRAVDDDRVVRRLHDRNRGKGAAVRTAATAATGDLVIVCDADLEYLPEEIPRLLQPVLDGDAEVVYGTRTFGSGSAYSFWYVMGNKAVTLAANVLWNSYLSDLETCFKLMPLALYRELEVRAAGFGMEAEITGKLLARGIRPYEVPITYRARSRADGKKITWRDGVEALWILGRLRLSEPARSR